MHSFDDSLHFHDLQWKQNLFHTLALCVKFNDHNALMNGWEDQLMYIESSEFCQFFKGGLASLGFIFLVISSSILKISVLIW